MALTDKNMQDLQKVTKENANISPGKTFSAGKGNDKQKYKVVNSANGATQAIAVAPVGKNGKVDYSQTAIVVAGTQPVTENITKAPDILNDPLRPAYREISSWRAIDASEGYGPIHWGKGHLTKQVNDVNQFYNQTNRLLPKNGKITNISGHSQAAPAVAKVAAKHKVGKITNFDDWGGEGAVKNGDITKSDIKYLNKHAHIYSDAENDVTKNDGHDGEIPYGKVYEVDGKKHSAQYPRIKGNKPDVSWYVKHNQFCSGMTKAQVEKVAKAKAKAAKKTTINPTTWFDSTDYKDYMKDYTNTYGSYAKGKKKKEKKKTTPLATQVSKKLKDFENKGIDKVHSLKESGDSGRGGKSILLKPEGIPSITTKAKASVQRAEKKLRQAMDETKQEVHQIIEQTRNEAFSIAPDLSAGEIEELLAEIDFSNCWDQGAESDNLILIKQYVAKVEKLTSNINTASDTFQSVDEEEANGMNCFRRKS